MCFWIFTISYLHNTHWIISKLLSVGHMFSKAWVLTPSSTLTFKMYTGYILNLYPGTLVCSCPHIPLYLESMYLFSHSLWLVMFPCSSSPCWLHISSPSFKAQSRDCLLQEASLNSLSLLHTGPSACLLHGCHCTLEMTVIMSSLTLEWSVHGSLFSDGLKSMTAGTRAYSFVSPPCSSVLGAVYPSQSY